MTNALKVLTERLHAEQSLKQELTRLLQGSPEGSVQISLTRGHPRFYRIIEGRREYLGSKDSDLVRRLVQKDYYCSMLREAEKESNALRLFLKHFDPNAHVRIYEKMHAQKKPLVSPLILSDEEYAKKWLEEARAECERTAVSISCCFRIQKDRRKKMADADRVSSVSWRSGILRW